MKSGESTSQGIVRNVQWREKNGYTILTFRIELLDDEGNITSYVPIELRETMIQGSLVDGDEVNVRGTMNSQGILIPSQILNVRTNSYITKTGSNKGLVLFLLPFIFGIIGLFIHPFEGALIGFLVGCFCAVFLFIVLAVIYSFKR